jgi:hypothetical protein
MSGVDGWVNTVIPALNLSVFRLSDPPFPTLLSFFSLSEILHSISFFDSLNPLSKSGVFV